MTSKKGPMPEIIIGLRLCIYAINVRTKKKKKIKLKKKKFNQPRFIIKIISPNKFKLKGPPKFAIQSKNQKILTLGKKFKNDLFIIIIRE